MSYTDCIDVGDELPHFDLDSQLGRLVPKTMTDGRWALFFTFPRAFDPVATTDIATLCRLAEEFSARNIFIIGIGMDSLPNYRQWIRDVEAIQSVSVDFPILSDPDASILRKLGCCREHLVSHEPMVVSVGAFLIDLDKRIRFSSRSSPYVGRNWYEVLRQFDALMITTYHPLSCPSNWGQGQQVLVKPDASATEARDYRYMEIKPWFRVAPCPDQT